MLKNTSESYGTVAKFFHWLVAILVIIMLIVGYFLDDVPKDFQPIAYNTHKLIGLTILSLVTLRFLWRIVNTNPKLPLDMPAWQHFAARGNHYLLYVALFSMPLFGWIGSVAAGHVPHIGDINIGLPIEPNEQLADVAFTLHGYTAILLITLITLHVLAALYHHFIRKDNVLRRML